MAADTLTLELSGDVSLAKFAEAMKRFQALIADLSKDIAKDEAINWRIEDLNKGSAIATIQGYGAKAESVERVVRAYGQVGNALAQHTPIPYSDRVKKSANKLVGVIDGGVTALRFETPFTDAIVGRQTDEAVDSPSITFAYGVVKGRVETLTSRRGLRFTIYDSIFDRPISCYLNKGQEEQMRDVWGRQVNVSGLIGREPDTRRPVVVREVETIELLADSEAGGYRLARGVLGSDKTSPRSELIIRSMRDVE